MNKKGQSLSLNTIIIAIMVLLVLIVVVVFFLGGFGRIKDTIVNVFYPISTGTDYTIAHATAYRWDSNSARTAQTEKKLFPGFTVISPI